MIVVGAAVDIVLMAVPIDDSWRTGTAGVTALLAVFGFEHLFTLGAYRRSSDDLKRDAPR
jgi:hypothetical protein